MLSGGSVWRAAAAVGVPLPLLELGGAAAPLPAAPPRGAALPCRLSVCCSACSAGSVSGSGAASVAPPPGALMRLAGRLLPLAEWGPSDRPLLARERKGEEERPSVNGEPLRSWGPGEETGL
jgi:hypothetical protein